MLRLLGTWIGAAAILLLVACGGGGDNKVTTSPTDNPTATEAAQTPTASPSVTPAPTATPYSGIEEFEEAFLNAVALAQDQPLPGLPDLPRVEPACALGASWGLVYGCDLLYPKATVQEIMQAVGGPFSSWGVSIKASLFSDTAAASAEWEALTTNSGQNAESLGHEPLGEASALYLHQDEGPCHFSLVIRSDVKVVRVAMYPLTAGQANLCPPRGPSPPDYLLPTAKVVLAELNSSTGG